LDSWWVVSEGVAEPMPEDMLPTGPDAVFVRAASAAEALRNAAARRDGTDLVQAFPGAYGSFPADLAEDAADIADPTCMNDTAADADAPFLR
jgi:hypothetical protein